MTNGGRRETQPVRRDSGFRVAKRALVFEGRPATLTPLVEILECDGYLVQIATNWDVIAEKLRLFVPHVVLVDLDVRRLLMDHPLASSEFAGFPFGRFPPIVGFSNRKPTAGPELAALIAKPIIAEDLVRILAGIVHAENARRASVTPRTSSSR